MLGAFSLSMLATIACTPRARAASSRAASSRPPDAAPVRPARDVHARFQREPVAARRPVWGQGRPAQDPGRVARLARDHDGQAGRPMHLQPLTAVVERQRGLGVDVRRFRDLEVEDCRDGRHGCSSASRMTIGADPGSAPRGVLPIWATPGSRTRPGALPRLGAASLGRGRVHRDGGSQAEQGLDLGAPIEALALDALAVALQHPAAHVGVEGLALHPEQARRLVPRQVLVAVDHDHGPHASSPPALRPGIVRLRLV